MSKVDPEELSQNVKGVDRRSTVLLAASRSGLQPEKHHIEEEEPSVDALRGIAGIAGSIHRARSARRSMMSESNSNCDLEHGRRQRRSTSRHHLYDNSLPRHQLVDEPLPEDFEEQISLHSKGSQRKPDATTSSPHIDFAPKAHAHLYPQRGDSGPILSAKASVHDETDIPMASLGYLPTVSERDSSAGYSDPYDTLSTGHEHVSYS